MKKVFDASGFPVITVRLPYVLLTAKVNARGNHAVTVWVRYLKVEICRATVTYFLQDSASMTAVVVVAVAVCFKSLISCKFFTYLRPNHIVSQPAIPPVIRQPNQAT